jgi:hypothetical protein
MGGNLILRKEEPVFTRSVVAWIVNACCILRRSQAKTLAQIVKGAMRCRRVSQADIGRAMETGTVAKHNIKRVSRFVTNNHVNIAEGCRGLIRIAANSSGGCLLVAVDWVDIGRYKVLKAAVPIRGRAVPILFAAYPKWRLKRSQNAFEEAFFELLASLVPPRTWTVVIADRGFARAELVGKLRELRLNHVIRVSSGATFTAKGFAALLSRHGVKEGGHRVLGWGLYTKRHPVERRVIVTWERGHEKALILGTDLLWHWRKVVAVFKQRMSIEELFRDEKNIRYGWGLRQLKIGTAGRLERLLLVLAFAYLLLLLIGLVCRDTMSEAHWASAATKTQDQACGFTVGRYMLDREKWRLKALFEAFARILTGWVEENWG